MARVLARHCGYEPLEINASDERTGTQILDKIKSAISSDDFFSQNKRKIPFSKNEESPNKKPVCLIVDEVDGALGSSLDSSKGVGLIVDYLKKCIAFQ
jgi:chromosome transmission fidelity protein 18